MKKLINCHHVKKRPNAPNRPQSAGVAGKTVAGASAVKLEPGGGRSQANAGQLFTLSLMCLFLASDFQQQIANQYAQSQDKSAPSDSGKWFLLAQANPDANRLYEDLMMSYNKIVRPVQNNTDRVVVKLSLKLSQLIDVNLKNQMMTTNVWLNQEWSDYKLKWDPSEYGGIQDINLPAEQIWLPDIVLYNSAEGYFAVSIMTKAKVRYDGHVTWNPPAIFRSSCQIDITYFPFDSQICRLKFGSWTFGTKIDLRHINDTEQTIEKGTDLSEYYQNVEWDIMQASAKRNVITYICCPNDFYPDVTFSFKLRRKPLFYTVNLILPCIGITILSFLVFYLPSDSGEKVTLTISILVSLIFFLSVLIETIPSTSLAMPLLGKYLVFTMILITLSVCATVCVLNIHFRTPSTHTMSPWVKRWCINILPRYLFVNVPQYQSQQANVLPEQLIYMHNQAYQQRPPPLVSSQSKADQPQNHSNGFPPPFNSGLLTKALADHNKQQQANLLQLDPIGLESESHPGKQSTSPSSLFLPYLQSEAARRLQMQRSRSSERDTKSTSEQLCPPSMVNNCDQFNGTDRKITIHSKSSELQEVNTGTESAQTRASYFRTPMKGFLKSLLGRRDKVSDNLFKEPNGDHQRQSQNQQESSSSADNDYQHHNHFQTRASICSTNLWRIGPTRLCSVTPMNYPTYYRPIVQVVHHDQPTGPINTVTARCSAPHYHPGFSADTTTSSESRLNGNIDKRVIGALVTASASNMTMKPKGEVNRQLQSIDSFQQEMKQLNPGLIRGSQVPYVSAVGSLKQPIVYNENHMRSSLSMPPPPSPLSSEERSIQQIPSVEHQSSIKAPRHPISQQQHSNNFYTSGLSPTPVSLLNDQARLSRLGRQKPADYGVSCSVNNPTHQLSGHIYSSNHQVNLGSTHVNLNGNLTIINDSNLLGQQDSNQFQNLYNSFAPASSSLGPQFDASERGRMISRSRSTDHRLCMLTRGMQNHLSQPTSSQRIMNGSQMMHDSDQTFIAPPGQALNRTLMQPDQFHGRDSSIIGRALDQADTQRFQRQPTVYSLHSGGLQSCQSLQRNSAYLIPLETQLQKQKSLNVDKIRRSRSQSSLAGCNQSYSRNCEQCSTLFRNQSAFRKCSESQGCHCDIESKLEFGQSKCKSGECSNQSYEMPLTSALRQFGAPSDSCDEGALNKCQGLSSRNKQLAIQSLPPPLTTLGLMKLINEVDKAIQNAMFIAQHIDNLDEFESVKENWKYIAMVIDRIFLIVFLFACIAGSATIFAMAPWSHYMIEKPLDLQLTNMLALNSTGDESWMRSCM